MKFSTILALALASYTTLATAQQNGDFRAKNADDAEKLTNDFKKLTADSPCQSGQDACVGDQFAQCVNGKFALTSCASGTKCVVLPLVNKPGTSITCDTEADRKARLAEARGQQPGQQPSQPQQPQQPSAPPQGKNATNPDNGKTKNVAKGKGNNSTPQQPSAPPQGKSVTNPDNGKAKNTKGKDNGKTKNITKGKDNNTPQQPSGASPKGKNATTPDSPSQDPKVFRPQNAADAEKLTNDFKKLTANSPCQNGQDACVGDQFAQCVNGKFALTSCASGTKCVVLPLVNKPGTSITCDTEADRQARLAEARGQQPSQPKRRSPASSSQDPKVFRPQNAADAEKLTNDFKKLTANSPCQNGQNACVGDQFAQCVNGKFALTSCASGTKCVVLPLVNKPGTSITCDTEADRQARLAEARGQQPKRRSAEKRRFIKRYRVISKQ